MSGRKFVPGHRSNPVDEPPKGSLAAEGGAEPSRGAGAWQGGARSAEDRGGESPGWFPPSPEAQVEESRLSRKPREPTEVGFPALFAGALSAGPCVRSRPIAGAPCDPILGRRIHSEISS